MEFLEQIPDLDALLVPVGGGGLCSGMVVAAKEIKPTIKGLCKYETQQFLSTISLINFY